MSLSLLGAWLGGALTLLSPCSVMLLPAFFAYAFSSPGALIARTGVFFVGLATSLVPLGMLAGTFGAWVSRNRFEVLSVAAVVVIALGIVMLVGVPVPGLMRQQGAQSASIASVFALGTVYGLAGVCAGPLLGATLTYAAFSGDPVAGGLVLLVFAFGMVMPLLLLALLWRRLPVVQRLVKPREVSIGRWRNTWTQVIGGVLTVGVGVLLLVTRGTTSLGGLLGATDQSRIESTVLLATASVPDWVTVLIFVLLAGTWVTVAWLGRRGRRPGTTQISRGDRIDA